MMDNEKPVMETVIRPCGQTTGSLSGQSFDAELDARQLACPLPILRTKKALSQLTGGQVLKVVATDKEAQKDFAVFCRQTGNELLSSSEQNGEFTFYLRRR